MSTASPRPLYASIFVSSVQAHVDYYTKHFGMQLLGSQEAGNALLGYGHGKFAVQVQQAPSGTNLDLGSGFGHFGIVLPVSDQLKSKESVEHWRLGMEQAVPRW